MNVPLNLAAWHPTTWTTGPGRFFTLWVQGCPRRCPGCLNADFLPDRPNRLLSVAEVAALIPADVDGVCFSGGEPLAQAGPLSAVARLAQQRDLGVVCYTGYTLAQLRRGRVPHAEELLAAVDILIDGPYREDEAAPLLWRGSRNQQVHLLSGRYDPSVLNSPPVLEVTVGAARGVSCGLANDGTQALLAALAARGVRLTDADSKTEARS